jgi:hypothetical protein
MRMLKDGPVFARLCRYSLAIVGPFGSAIAQFALSLVLLRTLDQGAFGSFSFLLVASQFSWGIWSALFCAPLPVLMASGDASSRVRLMHCLLSANLAASVAAFGVFFALSIGLGVHMAAALLFAAYAAVALLRWFARAKAYATGHATKTVLSDLVYSITLLAGVALLIFGTTATLEFTYAILLLGALLGLLSFGSDHLLDQFYRPSYRNLNGYAEVWRRHSGWSLLGVLTTEATANAHVYIVTFAYGASAFAPLAASALLIRPIQVTMNALTEFERAQMARQIGDGRPDLTMASVRLFRTVLIGIWVVTGAAVALLLVFAPRLVFPVKYELGVLTIGASLWLLVAGARLLRAPEGVLLQAAGAFRPLAYASAVASIGSVCAVLAIMAYEGALWSIAGIFVGESMFALWTWREARRWRARAGADRRNERISTLPLPMEGQTK